MSSHAFDQVTPRKSNQRSKKKPASPAAPVPLAQLVPHSSRTPPLLWGLAEGVVSDSTRGCVVDLDRLARLAGGDAKQGQTVKTSETVPLASAAEWGTRLESWLSGIDAWWAVPADHRPGQFLLEGLAWCHALPALRALLGARACEQLHAALQDLVREGEKQLPAIPPWPFHLGAELAWTLGYLFPEDPLDAGWEERSREALTHGICELTDGEGQVHARHLGWSYPLLACWTRCELMVKARHPGSSCFLKEGEEQFQWFVQQTLRWTRRDGGLVGLAGAAGQPRGVSELWETVLAMQADPATRFLAAMLLPKAWELTARRDAQPKEIAEPSPSFVGEWAEVAMLRTDWERNAPQLAVTYHEGDIQTELSLGKRVLWSGSHLPRMTADETLLEAQSAGELVCTFSDEDAEYVEIEVELSGDWRLQRQILLGRADQFLLIADALLGPGTATINYEHRLPLTEQTDYREEVETLEGWLVQEGRELARVLPLALPEWRTAQRAGSLEAQDEALVLRQRTSGTALFCPLFLDLSSKRRSKPLTWRQLTVAERLQIQPYDVAVGYRVQVGKQQWLIYRSLRQPAARTVLGQHFSQEFVMGRFTPAGELEQILQIE